MNDCKEVPLVFSCNDADLVGIIHHPEKSSKIGMLVVVGGPQYRVGSHRQFLLLARFLCSNGFPVMRFDYQGMGDSDGLAASFENVEADIRVAVDTFCTEVPELEKIVVWGLCDAASAAMFYAYQDSRISSLILLNPWVRTEEGMARAYLRHYYLQRLFSPDFWKKIITGNWKIMQSLTSLIELSRKLHVNNQGTKTEAENGGKDLPLPERMAYGFDRFTGKVLFILSGNNDYVADEFRDLVAASRTWQKLMSRKTIQVRELPQANHTFSRSDWRGEVEKLSLQWLHDTQANL